MLTFPAASGLPLLLGSLLLVIGTPAALAETEFERGYREGYGQGYQDGLSERRSAAVKPKPYSGAPGIVVIRAWYGDDHRSCDLTSWAAGRFNNRTSAAVDVSNSICGDPAPGKRKSLQVEFYCKGELKTADAYEHRQLSLNCY